MERSHPPLHRQRTIVLITMSLVTALVTLDTTITGVILPSIGHSLHATFAQLEWAITGYMLPFAALLIPAGVWADRIGRRRAVLVGMVVFAIGSLLCGITPSVPLLTIARILQGAGAALLPSASIAVIGHTFRGEQRTRAFALWGAVIGLATTAGPVVGGLIASWIGWRWAFLVNLPVCLVLAWATLRWVGESRDPRAGRFDFGGLVTLTSALLLLTDGFIEANTAGWGSGVVVTRLAGAVGLFGLFGWIEARRRHPMVDLRLFRGPRLQAGVVAMVGYATTAQILIFYVPLYLQATFGYSAMTAGLGMLPFAVPLFLAPRWSGSLAKGRPAGVLLTWGLILTAVGNAAMAFFAPRAEYLLFAIGMAVAGCGAGFLNGETTRAIMAAVPAERSGMASGLAATVRFTALMIGVAVMGTLLAHTTTTLLHHRLNGSTSVQGFDPLAKRVVAGDIAGAVAEVPEPDRANLAAAAKSSFASGVAVVFSFQAALAGIGAWVTSQRRLAALRRPAEAENEAPEPAPSAVFD